MQIPKIPIQVMLLYFFLFCDLAVLRHKMETLSTAGRFVSSKNYN